MGTPLTNKYAEGYPGRRYYGGCEIIDQVEQLAIDRLKQLFGSEHANVQPHSGAQANFAAFMAVIPSRRNDHGDVTAARRAPVARRVGQSQRHRSGERSITASIRPQAASITTRCGSRPGRNTPSSSSPVAARTRESSISRRSAPSPMKSGALFLVDMAHFAGLVAGGVYPSPVPHAQIVTSTTHKTLRGPRAGLILSIAEHAKAIDKSVFPGTQGGPLEHVIAAKAVAFGEALTPDFKAYAARVVKNAQTLADALVDLGYAIVSGGTDTHLMLVDLRPKNLTGKVGREDAWRGWNHGEQEHRSGRSAVAVRHQRHPARHAGAHDAWHGHGRNAARRRTDRRGAHPPRRDDAGPRPPRGRRAHLGVSAVRRPPRAAGCGEPRERRSRRRRPAYERTAVRRRRSRSHPRAGAVRITSAGISSCWPPSNTSSPGWRSAAM